MEAAQARWLEENVERWQYLVDIGDRVECNHLHTDYAVLHKSLHKEWYFVQRITPGIGKAFQKMEDALHEAFLSALLKGATSQIPGRWITGLPVKQSGIYLPDPTHTAGSN